MFLHEVFVVNLCSSKDYVSNTSKQSVSSNYYFLLGLVLFGRFTLTLIFVIYNEIIFVRITFFTTHVGLLLCWIIGC